MNNDKLFNAAELIEDGLAESDITDDETRLLDDLGLTGESRRHFIRHTLGGGLSVFAMQMLAHDRALASLEAAPDAVYSVAPNPENAVTVAFKLNGEPASLVVDTRTALLDALRENLGLTGTKKGCDVGQCGACTVIVNGRRVLSCLTLAATCRGKEITTIEGLASGNELHPMQSAFIEHDGFQCGYCTPGQICSAVALLDEAANGEASAVTSNLRTARKKLKLSDDEIRERMSGNLCRCGAYAGIVAAVREVQSGRQSARTWSFSSPTDLAALISGKEESEDASV